MALRAFLVKISSTFFYLGFTPLFPGTFGSGVGLFLFYLFRANPSAYSCVTGAILILGFIVSGRAERLFNIKDPRYIVIDEVAGMLLALLFLPVDARLALVGFLLFRLLDTLKPYPASIFQEKKGSLGVMGDDIIAGLYTNIILQAVCRLVR